MSSVGCWRRFFAAGTLKCAAFRAGCTSGLLHRNCSKLMAWRMSPPACLIIDSIDDPIGVAFSFSQIRVSTFFSFDGAIGPHLLWFCEQQLLQAWGRVLTLSVPHDRHEGVRMARVFAWGNCPEMCRLRSAPKETGRCAQSALISLRILFVVAPFFVWVGVVWYGLIYHVQKRQIF